MTATIVIACPQCKAQLRGPAELKGKKVRCKNCGHTFVVGATAPAAKPGTPAASAARSDAKKPAAGADSKSKQTADSKTKETAKPAPPAPASVDKNIMERSAYGIVADEETMKKLEEFRAQSAQKAEELIPTNAAGKKANPIPLIDVSLKTRCPHCAAEMPNEEAIICLECGYNLQTRTRVATKRTYGVSTQDVTMWRLPGIVCAVAALLSFIGILFLWIGLPHMATTTEASPFAKKDSGGMFSGPGFKLYGTFGLGFLCWYTARFAYKRLVVQPNPPEIEKKK
jgi:DNA-directed RNA polymerase subunit RPC12/RpoP